MTWKPAASRWMRCGGRPVVLALVAVGVLAGLAETASAQRRIDDPVRGDDPAVAQDWRERFVWDWREDDAALGVSTLPTRRAQGVVVAEVHRGGPADQAGLREGDQILEVDRRFVASPQALRRTIGARDPGERVWLTVARNGRETTLPVRLQPRDVVFDQRVGVATGRAFDGVLGDERFRDPLFRDDRLMDRRFRDDRVWDARFRDPRLLDGRFDARRFDDPRFDTRRFDDTRFDRFDTGRFDDTRLDRFDTGRFDDRGFDRFGAGGLDDGRFGTDGLGGTGGGTSF